MIQSVTFPIRTVSENAYRRMHWAARSKRTRAQRNTVFSVLSAALVEVECSDWDGGADVTLTRIAPRPLDSDNLQGALKSTRDATAQWMRVDDGSEWIHWHYAQVRATVPGYYGLRITISDTADGHGKSVVVGVDPFIVARTTRTKRQA
jgi:hypothetical protein